MTLPHLPDLDDLRHHPELGLLATLAVTLALTREALGVSYPDEPDPLCPSLYAVDLVLHHIAGLEGALALYRDRVAEQDALRFF